MVGAGTIEPPGHADFSTVFVLYQKLEAYNPGKTHKFWNIVKAVYLITENFLSVCVTAF